MSTMLVSVAELSNIFSVLAVLVCFCAMVLFILRNMVVFRLHGDEFVFGGTVHPVQPQIPQMKMMKVHIPFTFKIQESSKSSYNDLQCTLSSQVNYTLHSFWGVSIRELHLFLWRPWGAIQNAVRQKTLLSGYCQQQGITLQEGVHGDKTITMHLPSPDSLDLGTPPRLCYPLVIFLIRDDTETPHPDETSLNSQVALINVVHIKDSVCTLPTSILAQYLKQANGQLSCLKPLYLANGNPLGYDDEPPSVFCEAALEPPASDASKEAATPTAWGPTSGGGGQEQLCVVCQYFPLSRALLPCRHTCICASCFGKLDRCPMCRSPIRSFFCIRKEDYLPAEARSSADAKPLPLHRWLLQWNDRLTDLLGFH